MISISKLSSLPEKTQLRKIAALLKGAEQSLSVNGTPDRNLLRGLFTLVETRGCFSDFSASAKEKLNRFISDREEFSREETARLCNAVRHGLYRYLGIDQADWDFIDSSGNLDAASRNVLQFKVYLDDVRSPFNVGSIFRSAEAFGVSEILLSPATPLPSHPRARRSAMGCTDIIPWRQVGVEAVASYEGIFALEVGGIPLDRFTFPKKGIVLVGSEELGLSPEACELADRNLGRVSIPLGGAKASLNVGVAFGILMYHWFRAIS